MHSFDRLYVVTKFMLPIINDLNFSLIDFDEKCDYVNAELSNNHYWKECITDLKTFCEKKIPFIDFIRNKLLLIIVHCINFWMKYLQYCQISQRLEKKRETLCRYRFFILFSIIFKDEQNSIFSPTEYFFNKTQAFAS